MVDFGKLRTNKAKSKAVDPVEIFRRLPKPEGINDLYSSQSEVLSAWFSRRQERDTVVKLHTGGGKTMVGLLIAQSTMNELSEPVLYLAPTVQLVTQTLEKANALGIAAVPYVKRQDLNDDFVNGNAVMVATYNALFHGKSKFGLRGEGHPQKVGGIVLDDAHAAFGVVREAFTLEVSSSESPGRYRELVGLFRGAFKEIDRLGTFDDVIAGSEFSVLEVPYWAWHEQIEVVRHQLKSASEEYPFQWPLLRDNLHLCHALISRGAFTITPIVPLVNLFPTFADAARRIYMSATIADDSDIVRTFDADPRAIGQPVSSRSLAGISERMVLIPDLMPFRFDARETAGKIAVATANRQLGAVILVPSDKVAQQWSEIAEIAQGPAQAEAAIKGLQDRRTSGPVVLSNRYDGVDLPGDSCRLLILHGLPTGTSHYEIFRAASLYGGTSIHRMLAQRLEQGIGRGARGAGDYCVVVLVGADLAGWIAKEANFRLLTDATRAQLQMGIDVSREVVSAKDLGATIVRSFTRDPDWMNYHAETLAELVDSPQTTEDESRSVIVERKAINLWQDGYHGQAIGCIEKSLNKDSYDVQTHGWLEQLAARIADHWENKARADEFQRSAYAHNRNLLRPKVQPPYRPIQVIDEQAIAVARNLKEYHIRRGLMKAFDDTVSNLHSAATSGQFEGALAALGNFLGLVSERYDDNGKGPDVLWLFPEKRAWVIEAKSRKRDTNPLNKGEHGQLLVAAEWFKQNYPQYKFKRVSVHPMDLATEAAAAQNSFALTYENISRMVAEARKVLSQICESQLPPEQLEAECGRILAGSQIGASQLFDSYLIPFK